MNEWRLHYSIDGAAEQTVDYETLANLIVGTTAIFDNNKTNDKTVAFYMWVERISDGAVFNKTIGLI